ncbi:BamA/TamA family outer membrane protein [bacterium]|nr:BamA/TamA family outer membrane protein [bacterium]
MLFLFIMLVVSATSVFAIEETHKTALKSPIITVDDDAKMYIKDIEITGANVVKPEYILEKMQLHSGDAYNRDLLQTDLKRIYQTGFFSDKLKAIPIKNPDNTITLKVIVEENIPMTDFTIEGNTVVSKEEILSYLLPLKGKPQNVIQINEAIEGIQNCYAEKGYILARISEFYDDPDGVVNLRMSEGIINKIEITGNEKTKDYVIERNILTQPGMIYNENLLKADLVRLYATQAFKDVTRDIEPSLENPETYDITIEVKEQHSATISLGAGLDSATGFFGSAGITDNNFLGKGQRIGINFLAGSGVVMSDASVLDHANLQAEINFFEPYFLNADNSLSAKLFFRDFGSYQVPLAIEQRFGGEITVSHKVKENENLVSTFTIGAENINVKEGNYRQLRNLAMAKIPMLNDAQFRKWRKEQLEGGFFVQLAPGLVYDTRDSLVNTRDGVIANVKFSENISLSGLNKTHGKLEGSIKKYFPVMKKSSFSLMAKAGGIIHGADDAPAVMQYRLGGPYTIRGYKVGSVGTGAGFVMGSAELNTPVLFLDRIKKVPFFDNLKLSFFVDAGKVLHPNDMTNYLYNRPGQAITAGIGLKLYIPGLGPMSIDYGIPLTNPMGATNRHGYFTFGVGDMMY